MLTAETSNSFNLDTRLKYIFIRDVFTPIIEATLAAKTSSYATIMDLDRRIREADFPFATEPIVHPDDPNYHSITHSIRDYCTSQARAICEPIPNLRFPNLTSLSDAIFASKLLRSGIFRRFKSA